MKVRFSSMDAGGDRNNVLSQGADRILVLQFHYCSRFARNNIFTDLKPRTEKKEQKASENLTSAKKRVFIAKIIVVFSFTFLYLCGKNQQ